MAGYSPNTQTSTSGQHVCPPSITAAICHISLVLILLALCVLAAFYSRGC